MSQTFSGTIHLSSSSVAATAVPITMVIWVNTSGGQNRRFFELCASGADSNLFGVVLDPTSGSNKVGALRIAAGSAGQCLTGSALTTSSWQHLGAVFTSASS